MIKLIIADDEENIREGLASCINWSDNDITVIATTADGECTYNKIISEKPDVVLIDIKMPKMSGLQVIQRIREDHNMNTAFVILSGYDDFVFAQKALKFHVHEYILKPCKPEDILKAVLDCTKHINLNKTLSPNNSNNDFYTFYSKFNDSISNLKERTIINYPIEQERRLISQLQLSPIEECMVNLDSFLEIAKHNNALSSIVNCCVMLYMKIYRILVERGVESNFTNLATVLWDDVNVLSSLENSLRATISEAYNRLNTKRETSISVSNAIRYIEENYKNELSLEIVANAIFISPSYLSGLFKQSIGMTFVDYIHTVRTEKAKNYLANMSLRNCDIAENVGYACEKYFAQVFKKRTIAHRFAKQTLVLA